MSDEQHWRSHIVGVRFVQIMSMITSTEWDNTKFCYQLIITITKFKHKKFWGFFASSEKKPF